MINKALIREYFLSINYPIVRKDKMRYPNHICLFDCEIEEESVVDIFKDLLEESLYVLEKLFPKIENGILNN